MKDILYYLFKGDTRRASIHLSALLIWYKIKLIRWANRSYRKKWPIVLASFIMLWVTLALFPMIRDYNFIGNYAHFEALSSDYYNHWNTEGSPGQEPTDR